MAEDDITSRRSSVKVDVWNKALHKIGQTEAIQDEGEDRLAASICRRQHDDCLEEALGMNGRDWSFARRQVRPAKIASSRVGWANTYALPEDFITAQAIISGGQRFALTPHEGRIAYELQANDAGDGRVLCTDYEFESDDALEYTFRNENVIAWTALFISAMAWRLAAELALAIPKNPNLSLACSESYFGTLAQAYSQDLNSQTPDQPLEAESLRARR